MKYGIWIGAALSATITFGGLARPAEAAARLDLQRVMLSTGGVGYFEYEATVQGTADLPLRVRLDQVDDVLKSIVVYDSGGNLGEVSLPGKELLREAFRDLPFNEEALESPAALLGALRGADVQVEAPGRVVKGRIVSVSEENSTLPSGGTVTRHRLTLLSKGALQQFIVEEIQRLTVADAALQAQIDAALAALAQQRDRKSRELVLHIAGTGERVVRVGYVVEVPLWKTTYRLTLPRDLAVKEAALSGLAVVENRSGEDWRDIDLTLVSGNPVTFRQAIYETYYVDRPEVPVEVLGRVLPRPDEGGVPANAHMALGREALMARSAPDGIAERGFVERDEGTGVEPPQAIQETTQVIFHMPEPVSIEEGQTTLLPIINASLPAERVSLYQRDVERRHPLSSVQITNNSGTDLPPGALTLYEQAQGAGAATYVGDAQLSLMPVDANRFVSFAVDLRVTVDRKESIDRVLTIGSIVDGTLKLTRTERRVTNYTVVGAAREPRTVILEHPRATGFELVDSAAFRVHEVTETHYRLAIDLPAGGKTALEVALERPVVETVALTNLSREEIIAYTAAGSALPQAVRAALSRIGELQAVVTGQQAALNSLLAERTQITEDEARVRENLAAVPEGSDLHKRYLAQLKEQDNRFQALRGKITAAQGAVAQARTALAEYIRGLRL